MKNKKLKIDETLPLSYETQSKETHVLILPSDKFLKKYYNKIKNKVISVDSIINFWKQLEKIRKNQKWYMVTWRNYTQLK